MIYDPWYVILIFPIIPTKTNQLQKVVDLQQITESRPHLEITNISKQS